MVVGERWSSVGERPRRPVGVGPDGSLQVGQRHFVHVGRRPAGGSQEDAELTPVMSFVEQELQAKVGGGGFPAEHGQGPVEFLIGEPSQFIAQASVRMEGMTGGGGAIRERKTYLEVSEVSVTMNRGHPEPLVAADDVEGQLAGGHHAGSRAKLQFLRMKRAKIQPCSGAFQFQVSQELRSGQDGRFLHDRTGRVSDRTGGSNCNSSRWADILGPPSESDNRVDHPTGGPVGTGT